MLPACSELQIEFTGVALSSVGTIKQSEAYVGDRLGMYMYLSLLLQLCFLALQILLWGYI